MKAPKLTNEVIKKNNNKLFQSLFSVNCGMLLKRLFTVLSIAIATNASAQLRMTNFCEGIDTIMKEAPTGYKNIMARMMESNVTGTMWASTIKIPGAIGYRIVQSMGMFYEAAFVQSTNKDDLTPVYAEYKDKITKCLESKGYKLSSQENFTAGLSDFRKLIWMIPPKEGMKADELPPHVTMEATYNKDIGKFTIVMFIFQH